MPETQTVARLKDRTNRNRRSAPPPALPQGDQLDRTADRVVNAGGRVVHEVIAARFVEVRGEVLGYEYSTRCADILRARTGAMRTTRGVNCAECVAVAALTAGVVLP